MPVFQTHKYFPRLLDFLFNALASHAVYFFCTVALSSVQVQAQEAPTRPPSPCIDSKELKQFDFWLGTWRVSLADGTFAGKNTITREQNGCVLMENWRGAQGGSGVSMNYFDQAKQQWVQMWTGSEGSQIHIAGGLKDGSMVLVGKLNTLGQPQSADFRGTWTLLDDGRVRQFFEQSNDAGKSWQPWFEGFYRKTDAKE